MHINTPIWGHLQNLFWQNLAKGRHHTYVCLTRTQTLHTLQLAYPLRLINWNSVLHSCLFYWRRPQSLPSSLRFIRLGYDKAYLVSCHNQSIQYPTENSGVPIKMTFIYYFHILSSTDFSYILYNTVFLCRDIILHNDIVETFMEPQFSIKFNGLFRTAESNCPYSTFKKLPQCL